jgi:CRISPR-associated protein Csx3
VHQVQPYLEITSGPWVRGKVKTVSESILKYTKSIFVSKS